jgi:mRNA-degrading endonuclease HigB of HigAB toxin-antitoxin module
MRLVGSERLVDFCNQHAEVRSWICAWAAEVRGSNWTGPADVQSRYTSASLVSDSVAVFNVHGTAFNLEVYVSYEMRVVSVVRWGIQTNYNK